MNILRLAFNKYIKQLKDAGVQASQIPPICDVNDTLFLAYLKSIKNTISQYKKHSEGGSIVTFNALSNTNIENLLIGIEPVQSGSGDPSPDNVRPISGWTGMTVQRTGKNLYPYETIPTYSYGWYSDYSFSGTQNKVFLAADTDYVLSFETTDAGQYVNLRVFDTSENLVTDNTIFTARQGDDYPLSYSAVKHAFALTGSVSYKWVKIRSTSDVWVSAVMGQTYAAATSPQLELGSTASDYEPYSVQTYPITFPSEAGTVYGGTLDVTTGVLTVTDAQIASYNGEALSSTWISDRDIYAEDTTPTTGAQVVYKLAIPQTYQLKPLEIKAITGINNIFADTGNIISFDYYGI